MHGRLGKGTGSTRQYQASSGLNTERNNPVSCMSGFIGVLVDLLEGYLYVCLRVFIMHIYVKTYAHK